ncbi:MAG: nitronate monooxygenase [Humibacillus sp.]
MAAVGEAGGLGFLSGGYATGEALAVRIGAVRRLSERPFGVNLFVPATANRYAVGPGLVGAARVDAVAAYRDAVSADARTVCVEPGEPRPGDTHDWQAKLDLVVRERVPVVSFTFGLPSRQVLAALRRRGVECVVTVSSAQEAAAALEAGADGLCVQGDQGGGHRGTLDPSVRPDATDLADIVAQVTALVAGHDREVSVVAAGGIATRGCADVVRAAGADAVQVGTALLLTPEAGTGLAYRRALADSSAPGTTVTRAFSGRLARCLATDFVARLHDRAPAAYPEVHHVTAPIRQASAGAGRPDLVALWAGTGFRATRAVPAAEVVAELGR